ncbi:MAG: PepSY domain-containing protein [Blautia sp.]|nr:PepSY domain-containing protein [Blautia sp.]
MKRFFMNITAAAILGTTVLGAALSASAAEAQAPTIEQAIQTAFTDAGVTGDQAIIYKQGFDFENGKKVFDVNFIVPEQTKFEYTIDRETGTIFTQERDAWEADDSIDFANLISAGGIATEITGDEAKEFALKDAGFTEDQVFVYKVITNFDDGIGFYEVNFFIPGDMIYEYDLDPITGSVIKVEKDRWDAEDEMEFKALIEGSTAAPAAGTAAKPAKTAPAAGTTTTTPAAGQTAGLISEDEAIGIAAADAGYTMAEINVRKSALEFDDGIQKYEICFITGDGGVFDYDINSATGAILAKDFEYAQTDDDNYDYEDSDDFYDYDD